MLYPTLALGALAKVSWNLSDFKKGAHVRYTGAGSGYVDRSKLGWTGVVVDEGELYSYVNWGDSQNEVANANLALVELRRAQLTATLFTWTKDTICDVLEGPNAEGRYLLQPVGKTRVPLWSRVPLWWDTTEFRFIDGLPADPFENPLVEDEAVAHPLHYGGDAPYEVIKVAEAWDFDKDAYLFNVLKYIARHETKGKPLEDLRKALWYLERKIVRLEEASA